MQSIHFFHFFISVIIKLLNESVVEMEFYFLACLILLAYTPLTQSKGATELTLQCKFRLQPDYTCVAFGFVNHEDNQTLKAVNGNQSVGKSNNDVSALTFKDQLASFLPFNLAQRFPNLKSLEVKNSSLISVQQGNFEGLDSLEKLIVEHNLIKSLNLNVFLDLINLKQIRLSGNELKTLHFSTFANNVELEIIALDNNRLEYIHVILFANLLSLKEVHLRNNVIEDLREKTFDNNKQLEVIDLSGNHLISIGPELLRNLANLKSFDFSNNTCVHKNAESLEVMVDVIKNSCFPPYLQKYENEIKNLTNVHKSLTESLETCAADLKTVKEEKTELESQVERANDEKSSIESERDACTTEKEEVEKNLQTSEENTETLKKNFETLTDKVKQCDSNKSEFLEFYKIINETIENVKIEREKCQVHLDLMINIVKLNNLETAKNLTHEVNVLRVENHDLNDKLTNKDNDLKKLTEENEKLKSERNLQLQPEAIAPRSKHRCTEDLQNVQTQLVRLQSPTCSSFFIHCLFQTTRDNGYICTARHILACKPDMSVESVDGTHRSDNTNEDVDTFEVMAPIFHFTNEIFMHFPNLRNIKVKNSRMSVLQPQLRSSKLNILDIEGNNFIEIPEMIFDQLKNLESLQLDHNQIEIIHLDSFFGLMSLKELTLKNNKISRLPEGVFDDLSSLTHLSLKDNFLTSLNGEILRNNQQLEVIQLDNNRGLTRIGANLLKYAMMLRIANFSGTCVDSGNTSTPRDVKEKITRNCQ